MGGPVAGHTNDAIMDASPAALSQHSHECAHEKAKCSLIHSIMGTEKQLRLGLLQSDINQRVQEVSYVLNCVPLKDGKVPPPAPVNRDTRPLQIRTS